MAIQLEIRNGAAASWVSTNPILSSGEMGVETDTGKFKIGNGSTVWNSLSYGGNTGAAQTLGYRSLGDGSDGTVVVPSGVTTLTRDMYYQNLTINGTGSIATAGYRIFVSGVLDLRSAPSGAITNNGPAGGNGSGATGGSATTVVTGSLGVSANPSTAGATGTTGAGATAGNVSPASSYVLGGSTFTSGTGGTGTNAGAAGSGSGTNFTAVRDLRGWWTNTYMSGKIISGGASGNGGSSGGGDNTNSGGGGGGGGGGAGVIAIYANIIMKDGNTNTSIIQAIGGAGGNGGSGTAGVTGGGGGGAGSGGGYVYIAYNIMSGSTIYNAINVSGGAGGFGGNGFGAGAIGGAGGTGGSCGRTNILQITSNISNIEFGGLTGGTNPTQEPLSVPGAAVGTVGGPPGIGIPLLVNL